MISVLYVFGNLLVVKEGEEFYGFVVKLGVSFVIVVNNGLFLMYLKLRRVMDVRRVFDEMVFRDLVSYNIMICGCFNLEMYEEFVWLFLENFD